MLFNKLGDKAGQGAAVQLGSVQLGKAPEEGQGAAKLSCK